MELRRKQRTLWGVAFVALADMALLFMAALYSAGATPAPEDVPDGLVVRPQAEVRTVGIPVTVGIERDDSIYLDGIPTDEDDLLPRLSDALRISGGSHVSIEAEPGVRFHTVSNAMTIAKAAGAKSLALDAMESDR